MEIEQEEQIEESGQDLMLPVEEEEGDGPGWLATYGDMMTLLLCFFVLLFAMSETQMDSFAQLVNSLKSAIGKQQVPEAGTREGLQMINRDNSLSRVDAVDELGGLVKRELSEIVTEVDEFIMKNSLGGQVKVAQDGRGAVITISDMVLFPPGRAEFNTDGEDLLLQVSDMLKQFDYHIKVEGHTDSIPIFTERFKSNWELSTSRASEIVRFFIENGIPPEQLSAEGFAEYRPVSTNRNESGRSQNRRVEIVYERAKVRQKVLASHPELNVLNDDILFK
ncbi:MAG: flagellar motor protein MotB [Candidatus Neomarinimicrobiota bacterium]